jgi:minor extracellular serine protease Vpr
MALIEADRWRKAWPLVAGAFALSLVVGCGQGGQRVPYPHGLPILSNSARGAGPMAKLSPELRPLAEEGMQVRGATTGPSIDPAMDQLTGRVAYSSSERVVIEAAIELAPGADAKALEALSVIQRYREGQILYAAVPVNSLARLARETSVQAVRAIRGVEVPPSIKSEPARSSRARGIPHRGFDAQGLDGTGVIVGVIDSGIDWRHPDFVNEDGTSRILYLYDPFDESWSSSNGTIGSQPPFVNSDQAPLGTLYTRDQISAALRGAGQVATTDTHGHGTACAGTAAGNGRGTANGVAAGTYKGVAPKADIIAVKVFPDDTDGASRIYHVMPHWIAQTAKNVGRPCVINLSLGGHWGPHNGTEASEVALDQVAGPGVAITVSAGNEGSDSFHAAGRFGPKREGQSDVRSEGTELFVDETTFVQGHFNEGDDWCLAIRGTEGTVLVDDEGDPVWLYVWPQDAGIVFSFSDRATDGTKFEHFGENLVGESVGRSQWAGAVLPPGRYIVFGMAMSANVRHGTFDLYLPNTEAARFGRGSDRKRMVGSPGNASNVITVGSYDFRDGWVNGDNEYVYFNLDLGGLSSYSSPGYRRDDVVKPDITAPGQFTISTLAANSIMGEDSTFVTQDGLHLAWRGTSASTPYTAGVIALILQKNPTLDAAQIRKILIDSATEDRHTGKVPNHEWGFGKLNPEKAIKMTPRSGQ